MEEFCRTQHAPFGKNLSIFLTDMVLHAASRFVCDELAAVVSSYHWAAGRLISLGPFAL
jgi:hypothetical protein